MNDSTQEWTFFIVQPVDGLFGENYHDGKERVLLDVRGGDGDEHRQ